MPSSREFLTYHLPALLYASLIFILSSIEGLNAPELGWLSTDKLVHALEYALFALLVYRSFSRIRWFNGSLRSALVALLFLALFAAGDEYHQTFVAGRSGELADLVADFLGGGIVIGLLSYRDKRRNSSSG